MALNIDRIRELAAAEPDEDQPDLSEAQAADIIRILGGSPPAPPGRAR